MVTTRKTTDYLRSLYVNTPALDRTAEHPVLPAESAALLRVCTLLAQPQSILEIGTNIGYSGITMLQAAPEAHLYTMEIDEPTAALARQNFTAAGVADRAHIIVDAAENVLPHLDGKYGLIFVDGPKGQYEKYLDACLPLLTDGGMIIFDNVLFRGMVTGDKKRTARKATLVKKLDAFLHRICNDNRLDSTVLPIGDGISISIKK